VISCKQKCQETSNPDCENYDPCSNKRRTSAAFVIEENVGERWIVGDTIDGGNMIRFRALQDADSFIWKLGAETIFSKSFTRTGFPPDEWIDVTLIVVNKNPSSCFPNDNGRDTFKKSFYSWERIYFPQGSPNNPPGTKFYPVYGRYWGYNVSQPDKKFLFRVVDTLMNIPVCPGTVPVPREENNQIVEGVPFAGISTLSPCLTTADHIEGSSPKALYLYKNGSAVGSDVNRNARTYPAIKAYVLLSKDLKTIVVDYQWSDTIDNKTWYNDKYIGTKLW
jgi:hypothetical protein